MYDVGGSDGTVKGIEKESRLNLGGSNFHVVRGGESHARGATVLFLHEGLGCVDLWRDYPRMLSTRVQVPWVAFDRLGHGRSDPMTAPRSKDYLHVEAWEVLPRVLDSLALTEPLILYGHSDGGTIALLFAARYPRSVSCVVTEAAHVFVEQVTLEGIRSAVRTYERGKLRAALEKYHGSKADALFYAWCNTWLHEGFRDWSVVNVLKDVSAPVLALQGMTDAYGSGEQLKRIRDACAGEVQTGMLPDCGHAPYREQPARTSDLVTSFLYQHLPLTRPRTAGANE